MLNSKALDHPSHWVFYSPANSNNIDKSVTIDSSQLLFSYARVLDLNSRSSDV